MAEVRVARGYETGTVDEADLEKAVGEGWSPVTDEQAKEITAQRQAGTVSQQALATGESFARGLTFGLSDYAAEKLGGDMDAASARKERLGYAGTAAEVAGAVAPALLSGGTGAAGAAARLTPAGAAARAGARVAGRGSLTRGALGAGLEGGLQGVGTELSEASLGEYDLTAERALSGFGRGAGLGGALGLGFGAAAKGLSAAGDGLGAMSRKTGAAIDNVGGKPAAWKDKAVKLWAGATGADQQALRETVEMLGDKEGRKLLIAGPDALQAQRSTLSRSYKSSVDASTDALDDMMREAGNSARAGNAARLMEPELRAAAHGNAVGFVRAQAKRLDDLLAQDAAEGLLPKFAKADVREMRRIHEKALKELEKQGVDGAEAFRVVDRMRQELGEISSGRFDEFGRSAKREVGAAARVADDFRKAARDHTVDESIYGSAAKAHSEDLAAWSEAIGAHKALKKKSPSLARLLDKGATDADLAPLLTLARNRAGSETKRTAFEEYFDKQLKLASVLKRNHDLTPQLRAKIERVEKSVRSMEDEFKKTADTARKVEALHTVRQTGETNFSPSSVTSGTAAMIGYGVGGLPGAALGFLSKPANAIRTMAAMREMVGSVRLGESGILSGIGRMIDGAAAPKLPKGTPARVATRAGISTAERDKRQRELLKARDQVLAMSQDPTKVAAAMSDPEMWHAAPNVAKHRMITSARAIAFLQSVAPTTYRPPFSGGAEMVDPVELDRYERHLEAVVDPMGTMGRLEKGTFTLEHSEALRAVYPRMFQRLQDGVLEEVGEREASGKPVAHRARVQLGILLDIPLDPSLQPGWALPPREERAPPPKAPSVNAEISTSSSMTAAERIERGGERA